MTDVQPLLSYEPAPQRAPASAQGETPAVIGLSRPDMASG